jgi:hypothetical protein
MTARRFFRFRVVAPLMIALFAILFLPGTSLYDSYSGGRSCARCHEIWQPYRDWHESAHRNVPCSECHGDVLTLDAGFHLKNIRQLVAHLRGQIPEQVRLKTDDVLKISARCARVIARNLRTGRRARTAPRTRISFWTKFTTSAAV